MSDIDITITKTGNAFHYSSNNSEVTTNGGNEGDIDLRNDSGGTKTITFARGSDQSWMFRQPSHLHHGQIDEPALRGHAGVDQRV